MKIIAVIGAGQLGSRHLQALASLKFPVKIEVVDPFLRSLEVAKMRFDELPSNPNIISIKYLSSIKELSKKIDFVIVATNADVRAAVIREITQFCKVKYMLLEKVLFQRPEEYAEFLDIFEANKIQAWVNHPRRLYPFYSQLKKSVSESTKVSYHIQGGAWGLACNGLHFIDHLAFLTGNLKLELNADSLDWHVLQSKRVGFVEFSGVLQGRLGNNPFTFFCSEDISPLIISIYADAISVIIDEASGWVRVATKEGGWTWSEHKEQITRLQSELTNIVIEDVIETGACNLPAYSEAVKLHHPFICCLKARLELAHNRNYDNCPIT